MGRRENLSLFEMELYHKTGTLSNAYKADDQRPYPRKGISCAIMTRGVITDDAKNTSKYEMFINRFVSVSIRRGIRRFIIALRNANDVLCAEIVQKHIFRSEGVQLICIDLGVEHDNALPQNIRSKLWKVLDQSDYVEDTAFAEDETAAEEQALLLADTLLFIHGMESGESIWNDFLCGIVKEEMSPNYFYDLKKIWLISLSDICDRT